jgi:hypothetical protein
MLIEKLQMLALSAIPNEQKVSWFMYWNKSSVLEAKKFPKQGFFDSTFDMWLHEAIFWSQVTHFINPTLLQLHILNLISRTYN